MHRVRTLPAGPLLALLATSCSLVEPEAQPRPVNTWLGPPASLAPLERVLVLPFNVEDGVSADEAMIRAEFSAEFQKLQRFEILTLPDRTEDDRDLLSSLVHGRLSTQALIDLARRFDAHAVLVGTVLQFRPYPPPVVGLRLQLISVFTGASVWAAEGVYDCGDATTRLDVLHYCKSVASPETSLHGWEMTTLSPRRFVRFVSHRLLTAWRESETPERPPEEIGSEHGR